MKEIKSFMYQDGQQLFSINREEIEGYLQDDEFDGFQVIINRIKNRVEVHKIKKPINVIDTEAE
ncbi:hypothetical protein [Mammaliicoccus sciuri]|uniref:hypothetical protein n=1 Tax=Mammaliicoccus sciuri TaxID=1296 RepID=UPI00265C1F31|nr:hypothetical protein [Mammaliicoccus sciuri]MDO0948200.1 hypothetical protein [Mammaliicoccus sciuri]MDO0953429.1 hypothetical protein [Mammaliicoccus sciuri]